MNKLRRPCRAINVPALLLLLVSVTGCSGEKPLIQTRIVYQTVPEHLTAETPTPALVKPVTWGGIALWADHLRDALDTCNADKVEVYHLGLMMQARQATNKRTGHAEN